MPPVKPWTPDDEWRPDERADPTSGMVALVRDGLEDDVPPRRIGFTLPEPKRPKKRRARE